MNKFVLIALCALFAVSLAHIHGNGNGNNGNGHGNNNNNNGNNGNGHGNGGHNGHGGHRPDYFHRFTGTEVINGVPAETRIKWMRFALETRLTKSPCPFDTFGAVIVNRTDDSLVCATFGTRSSTDPTSHAEISVIRNCSQFYPGKAYDKTVWQQLSLYTTGESCPMCMAATRWAGIGENIYATSIDKLFELGWTQIMISSLHVDIKSVDGGIVPPTTLISFADTAFYDAYFGYQYNTTNPCPAGCARNAAGSCAKITTPTA